MLFLEGFFMKTAIVYGAGGHGKVVYDILKQTSGVHVLGFIDDEKPRGEPILDTTVLGARETFIQLAREGKITSAVAAFAGVRNGNLLRQQFHALFRKHHIEPLGAVHPTAAISPYAKIHPTAQIFAGTIIGPSTIVGEGVIVNHGAQLDHDNTLGDYVHIAPGAKLMGTATVGDFAYIGAGATIRENLTIGEKTIVGMHSAVTKPVAVGATVMGVPARPKP